jgi:hypothetical protein
MEESIIMKKFAFVLALSLVFAGSALAINPSLNAGGAGPQQEYNSAPRNDIVWSEPADVNGLIASSEDIPEFGLQSEIANDFVLTADANICVARWWGGYYNGNGCGESGVAPNWNLRFYSDAGCVPDAVLYEYLTANAHEASIGCQAGSYPMFEYWADVAVGAIGGNLYWFGAQASGHVFPPQCGRLASMGVVNCESVFKSAFFAFPDWVAAIDVFGVSVDFSQQFETNCGVPTDDTTWGAIKGLYR